MSKNRFLDITQKPVNTSLGSIDFPMLYSDVDGLFASFWIDYDKAVERLSGTGLNPALKPFSFKKKSVLTLAFFEYRECSAGSYNEVAVAIHSYPEKLGQGIKLSARDFLKKSENRTVGTHIIDLPVTTDWAMAGGVEIYGYPKWVADIPLDFSENGFDGRIVDPSTKEDILRLSGKFKGPSIKTPVMDIMSYSILDKKMLKTSIHTDGYIKNYSGRGFVLNAGNSSHETSKAIRDFGLEGAAPFSVNRSVDFKAILKLGIPI